MAMPRDKPRLVNCIGFDDSPFSRDFKGRVAIVGTVYSSLRLDGVVIGEVEKDGNDAASVIIEVVGGSRFHQHCNVIMLQGISMAGFNVVDVQRVHQELQRPVLVVSRKRPDYDSIRKALLTRLEDGERKWKIIESIGPMEPCHNCFVQRVGLNRDEAERIIRFFCVNGNIPEPLRTAHLFAGALGTGTSRGRV